MIFVIVFPYTVLAPNYPPPPPTQFGSLEYLSETNIFLLKMTILSLAHLFFHVHCCGSTEAVIRLAVSVFVGVAAVAFPIYDIRATGGEGKKQIS